MKQRTTISILIRVGMLAFFALGPLLSSDLRGELPGYACWIVAAAVPILGFIFFAPYTRRYEYRRHHRLCVNCRYDLRTHNPGDKCPECGTRVPSLNPGTLDPKP